MNDDGLRKSLRGIKRMTLTGGYELPKRPAALATIPPGMLHTVEPDEQATPTTLRHGPPPRPKAYRPPSDMALRIAQVELDKSEQLDRVRDALLATPTWIPVGIPVMFAGNAARHHRCMAASLLECNPLDLED